MTFLFRMENDKLRQDADSVSEWKHYKTVKEIIEVNANEKPITRTIIKTESESENESEACSNIEFFDYGKVST